ncbi:MAG: UDP-N-acetylmuramoyl-L-alanine--D-glutamate ligase [Lachnospiraceae bacterium]|nr:UDP-N-acetylmuramoyl-L-alanine--D-glutamate ligase [Lachnospiraceae bacterium]
MDVRQKKVLVVGSGISGIGAADLLTRQGAGVILFDGNDKLDVEEIRKKLQNGAKTKIVLGELSKEEEEQIDLVVLSPGVPTDTAFVDQFRAKGIHIWGEIELGYRFSKGRLLAITGTNGKTTTTALTGRIMKDYFNSVYVVGNIGNPYTIEALNTTEESVTVAEISSFQLETAEEFRPQVSAILNITPDHLNRHHTMENYVAVKESIARNQTKEDYCILNYEDEFTRDFGKRCSARVVYFSSARELEEGIYLKGEDIYLSLFGETKRVMNIHEMKLLGTHNVENVMAAIAMSYCFGVPLESIVETVKHFRAVEHRIEYVATKRGVDYYNDSKGTNPDAAIKGIQAMVKPTVLIGGGYDKQSTYDEWIESFDGKVKWLVLLGQTREKIAECARAHGFTNIILADSFEETMRICTEKAEPGDAVLLSPACASWGMFPNYEVRGQMFKDYVNQLKE